MVAQIQPARTAIRNTDRPSLPPVQCAPWCADFGASHDGCRSRAVTVGAWRVLYAHTGTEYLHRLHLEPQGDPDDAMASSLCVPDAMQLSRAIADLTREVFHQHD
jgi:hypothetical protein